MSVATTSSTPYRGRIAPTPSGRLHLGHAVTFGRAHERARSHKGTLIFRMEDIDTLRCSAADAAAALQDLHWWGLDWDEGPECGGPFGPYAQSGRLGWHREVLGRLAASGAVYPSPHSRRAVAELATERSPVDGEWLFPRQLRRPPNALTGPLPHGPWRFAVPDGRAVRFHDQQQGDCCFVAGKDFGDFIVWRREDLPSYELAVVADDIAMQVTEVVRGADLLLSTARQILLYEALGKAPPAWLHVPLVCDPATGQRLAKSKRSLSLGQLRAAGLPPGLPPEFYFSALA
jgi:glutamyl-tRNA synthetase